MMFSLSRSRIVARLTAITIFIAVFLNYTGIQDVRADGFNPGIETFVTSLYSDCLGRSPDPSGLNDWCTKLANGTVSGKQCAYGFFFSSEFQTKANQWDDDTLINAYYRVFLNRPADPSGKSYWASRIANTTNDISILFTGFADSAEFANKCASYGITAGNHIDVPTTVRSTGSEAAHSTSVGTVNFDGLQITFGGYYEFVTLRNMFSDLDGADIIRIPFHIKNTGRENNYLNPFAVTAYGPSGREVDEVGIYFDGDNLWESDSLRPGSEDDRAFYLVYEGNGTYYIDLGYWRTEVEISFNVTK